MAIQNRRGNKANFDPNKLLAGEFAFSLDTEELFYCVSPGNVKRCATKEDIQDILNSTPNAYDRLMELVDTLEDDPALSTSILTDIVNLKANKLDKTGDTKDNTTTFTQATTRVNIATGEKHSTVFGKIGKFFADMKALAFKDKVASTDLEATLKAYIDAKFDKANLANNLITTAAGFGLDARQGKALQDQITAQNNKLNSLTYDSISIDNCLTYQEIFEIMTNNKHKLGLGWIGILNNTNLKTIITNPQGFANYTITYAIFKAPHLIELYAIKLSTTDQILAKSYLIFNNNNIWSWTGWNIIT